VAERSETEPHKDVVVTLQAMDEELRGRDTAVLLLSHSHRFVQQGHFQRPSVCHRTSHYVGPHPSAPVRGDRGSVQDLLQGVTLQTTIIATTKPSPFEYPTGPEAYSVLKELRELGDHPLASVWDHGLAERLRRDLNESCVMRQADNRFFDPVPLSDPTFTARDPYTAILDIPISTKEGPGPREPAAST
jgi:hypothetical protein